MYCSTEVPERGRAHKRSRGNSTRASVSICRRVSRHTACPDREQARRASPRKQSLKRGKETSRGTANQLTSHWASESAEKRGLVSSNACCNGKHKRCAASLRPAHWRTWRTWRTALQQHTGSPVRSRVAVARRGRAHSRAAWSRCAHHRGRGRDGSREWPSRVPAPPRMQTRCQMQFAPSSSPWLPFALPASC